MSLKLDRMHLIGALEGLRSLDDGVVDLILMDPAYDSMEKWRALGTTTRLKESKGSSNKWFPVVPAEYLEEVLRECYRVLKNKTHLYIMCEYQAFLAMVPMVLEVGFELRKPLIWQKVGRMSGTECSVCGSMGGAVLSEGSMGMGYPYRGSYEMILFAEKGKRPMAEDRGVRDVLPFKAPRGDDLYPTQKPVELMEVMIRQASHPGDIVVDPFAGSGTTLVAAEGLGRRFIGFDVEKDALTAYGRRAPHVPSTRTRPEDSFGILDLFGD